MRARAGFTLLEVTVGLTVAALALAAGFTALGFIGDRAAHADDATAAVLEAATTRQLLTDWLSGARVRASNGVDGFQGLNVEYESLPDDILLFPTTSRSHLRTPETVVRLYIDRDDETPERGLVAELTSQRGLESRRVELFAGAIGLDLRFLPQPTAGAPLEWTDQWLARNQLPRVVEVTIIPGPDVVLPPLLAYPLRVALGAP